MHKVLSDAGSIYHPGALNIKCNTKGSAKAKLREANVWDKEQEGKGESQDD